MSGIWGIGWGTQAARPATAPAAHDGARRLVLTAALALAIGLAAGEGARADAPRVATDIAPVHSLVARVMEGIGTPDLVVPPGASPHGYAMRPSEARALDEAAVVVWIGPGLAPWFGEAAEALAADAVVVTLSSVPGTLRLPIRIGGRFEGHGHDDEHEHGHGAGEAKAGGHAHDSAAEPDGHGHGHSHAQGGAAPATGEQHSEAGHGHADDDHAHDAGHTEAGHGRADGHDHAHDAGHAGADHGADAANGVDEHMWLDPANARLWLGAIAEALAAADPANAAAYRANAEAGQAELDALTARIGERLAPLRQKPFIVFHDAYQYFEARFGVTAAGAIALSDAARPSAARVAEIRETVVGLGALCVFSEPQFEPRVVATVIEGTGARRGTLDPLGAELGTGPGLYPALIENLAAALEDCLAASG